MPHDTHQACNVSTIGSSSTLSKRLSRYHEHNTMSGNSLMRDQSTYLRLSSTSRNRLLHVLAGVDSKAYPDSSEGRPFELRHTSCGSLRHNCIVKLYLKTSRVEFKYPNCISSHNLEAEDEATRMLILARRRHANSSLPQQRPSPSTRAREVSQARAKHEQSTQKRVKSDWPP